MSKTQFQKIADDITDLKVTVAKQELNASNMTKILDRLTQSVELHVKRSNSLEELVQLVRSETAEKIESELKPIKSHIVFIKGAMWAIGVLVAGLVTLSKLGILSALVGFL